MLLVCEPLTCMHIHISHSLSIYLGQGLFHTKNRRNFQMIFLTLLLSHHLFYYLCSRSLHSPIHGVFLSSFVMTPLMWPVLTLLCLSDYFCSYLFCLLHLLLCFCCRLMSCVCFYGLYFFSAILLLKMEWWRFFIPLLHFPECCTIQVCSSECLSSHIIMFLR